MDGFDLYSIIAPMVQLDGGRLQLVISMTFTGG